MILPTSTKRVVVCRDQMYDGATLGFPRFVTRQGVYEFDHLIRGYTVVKHAVYHVGLSVHIPLRKMNAQSSHFAGFVSLHVFIQAIHHAYHHKHRTPCYPGLSFARCNLGPLLVHHDLRLFVPAIGLCRLLLVFTHLDVFFAFTLTLFFIIVLVTALLLKIL